MWDIDTTYRPELQDTFDRLFEKKQIIENSRPLPPIALQKIIESISLEWTYNSNGIEGNTLNLIETQLVLQEGITIKGKSLKEHFETKNHETALNYLFKIVAPEYEINIKDILTMHSYILRSIEDDFAGRYRSWGVRITGANFTPPNALKVSELMDALLAFALDNPLHLNIIELTAIFHHKFVWIHPFFDGNGRTARLAMNLLLMGKGFPPAIILKNDRKKYYAALNAANNGNYAKLMLLFCQACERTLNIYCNALPGSYSQYEEISNLVKEEQLPYGKEYISLLARQGKIDAYKEGRNWLTSKKAIETYIQNRKRNR